MAHTGRSEIEPIPFFAAGHSGAHALAYGYVPPAPSLKEFDPVTSSGMSDEPRAASIADCDVPLEYDFSAPARLSSVVEQVVPQKKAPTRKRRAKSTRRRGGAPSADAAAALDALLDEPPQATRKSEIERKSRQKRASNMDTMKLQVTRLEQSLLRLTKQYHHQQHDVDAFRTHAHLQLPVHTRLVKIRELLAHQFQESVTLRNEQFQLYQRLQHFVDINESLRNVVSAHTFTDSTVYDLLSWWTPPTDAQCQQLAAESMAKVHAFTFSKRSASDEHAGWKLAYELSPEQGCKFMITRSISRMDVPSVVQTIWDARYTNEGANMLAGGVCKVDISVIKAVNKDMAVINRSMRFPDFAVHTLYLMFRVEVDGVFYIVSRELGRSQNMTWDHSGHDFPESSADKWVDVFTWSTFTKVPDDPNAAMCTGKCAQSPDEPQHTYRMDYGGWWGTSYAFGVRRWMLEMIFMVVRWEALHIQPVAPTGARLPQSDPSGDA